MERAKIQEVSGKRFLLIDYAEASWALRELIEAVLGNAQRETGGCVGVGQTFESYTSEAGCVELSFDDGFGYEFWANSPALHEKLVSAISASPIFILERRT